ncbi:MAG TPA: BatA and WFA domain-containing protein, partial [Longimicrobiales bacterium]
MNFLAPGAFFLGLLLPVIIALYLLKLRRTEREVSSVYLWRRMVRDLEANAPWQKLRPNLLMILQLLFLLAMILALARPFSWSEGLSGEAAILIIDSSASMSATDTAPSRLEAAKARARQLVDELPSTARATIIEAGREAAVRLSSSRDRRQAHLAIDAIQPGTGGSDLTVALELASAIAARQPGTEIVVLSDGRVALPARLALKGHLRYLPVGTSGENAAISQLNLEDRPGGRLAAFVQVSNYGAAPVQRRVSLYTGGQLFNVYDLSVPAGGARSGVVEDLPAGVQRVEARLDGSDILSLDDRAAAVRPLSRAVKVALVTGGNVFLETALKLLQGVEVTRVNPEDVNMTWQADLTIFDGVAPAEGKLPAGNLLFIAPPRGTDLFTVSGLAQTPTSRAVDASDPLLENISLAGVSVLDSVRVALPDWGLPVVTGDLPGGTTPLLFRGETSGRRVAVLAFDLHHSDLPLQTAFPLLFANLASWLAPGQGSEIPARAAPGELVSFRLPDGAETAAVRRPDGTTAQVRL